MEFMSVLIQMRLLLHYDYLAEAFLQIQINKDQTNTGRH